jgi:hypothetical protein
VFNVVIKMVMGNITDVIWDNDCYTCLTESTCYTSQPIKQFNSNLTVIESVSIKINCRIA